MSTDVDNTYTVWIVIKDEDGEEILSRSLSVVDVNVYSTQQRLFDFDNAYKFMTLIADGANMTSIEAL